MIALEVDHFVVEVLFTVFDENWFTTT